MAAKKKTPLPKSKPAEQGQKMIEVKVRFWTDGISKQPKSILPKHGWAGGVVRIKRNDSHGILPGPPILFNSLMEVMTAIEALLTREGITLHAGRQMGKFLKA